MSSTKRQLAASLNAEAEGSGFLTKHALLKKKHHTYTHTHKNKTLKLAFLKKAAFSGEWKHVEKYLCEAFCKDYSLQTDLAAVSAHSPNAIQYNYVKSISKATQRSFLWGFLGQERKQCDRKVFRSGSCACLASNCSETVNLCVVFQDFTLQNHSLCGLNCYTFKLTTSKSAV